MSELTFLNFPTSVQHGCLSLHGLKSPSLEAALSLRYLTHSCTVLKLYVHFTCPLWLNWCSKQGHLLTLTLLQFTTVVAKGYVEGSWHKGRMHLDLQY